MTKANVKERWSEHRKYYDEWLSGYDGGVFIPARKTSAGKENMGDKTEATEHYEIRLSRVRHGKFLCVIQKVSRGFVFVASRGMGQFVVEIQRRERSFVCICRPFRKEGFCLRSGNPIAPCQR